MNHQKDDAYKSHGTIVYSTVEIKMLCLNKRENWSRKRKYASLIDWLLSLFWSPLPQIHSAETLN